MTSAIGSVPPTTDLAARLYRSLEALVIKSELTLEEQDEMRRRNNLPARRCACDSGRAGPGCLPCLVRRGRKVMVEYKAQNTNVADADSNIPPCGDCGQLSIDTAALKFDDEGNVTAQCRACYAAMRERELEAAS